MEEIFTETVALSNLEPPSALNNPPEPKNIGSGVVTSLLGKGGAAVIYEIWNPKLEINRAVKLWRPTLSEKVIQRFETEMKITAKLRHPNIVEIYSVGEWSGLPFIEIEKIDGLSLKDLLKAHSDGLPIVVAAAIGICVCRALSYAHNQDYSLKGKKFRGVIHCDIKPANIMISKEGVVKLTDFGIALPSNTPGNSGKNKVTGSLQYMSPEQLASRDVDNRTDIFSLGAVLYEMFSGTKVFGAQKLETLIEKRKVHDITSLELFCKKLPPKIVTIVNQCINIDPEVRYQTANELMQDLEKVYYRYTKEPPDKLIKRFYDGNTIPLREQFRPFSSLPVKGMAAVIVVSVVAASLYKFVWNTDKSIMQNYTTIGNAVDKGISSVNKTEEAVDAAIEKTDNTVQKTSGNNVPKDPNVNVAKNADTGSQEIVKKEKKAVSKVVKKSEPSAKSQRKVVKKVPVVKKTEPVIVEKTEEIASVLIPVESAPVEVEPTPPQRSDDEIIQEMWRLVRSNDFSNSIRMLSEFRINDAEYYLIYGEYHLRKGNFVEAKNNALKAMQTQSRRLTSNEIRSQSFHLKARALSGEYEASMDKKKGQAAMEAWFDVKFQYRTLKDDPIFIAADREIRKISAQIQK